MKIIKHYVVFSRKQQGGIFFLLFLMGMLQATYFFIDFAPRKALKKNESAWLIYQHKIEALKQSKAHQPQSIIYPFNPNYLSDYKGYLLGLSTTEIDRLLVYRNSGKFIYSASAFQQLTQISDSLLEVIQPYFRFPDRKHKRSPTLKNKIKGEGVSLAPTQNKFKKDLNKITVDELKTIRGIGDVLSGRIIKFRKRLGGFLIDEQLYDVYGLSKEVANQVLQDYTVLHPPQVQKINVNTASVEELSALAYLYYKTARAIVQYRDSVGKIFSIGELTKIKDIPIEKIDRIKLYLETE